MLKSTIDDFITHANLLSFRTMCNKYVIEYEFTDNYGFITYIFPEAMSISDLLDELDESMEMIKLYHVIPSEFTTIGEQCCLYSNPGTEFIYKLNGIADENGLCNTLYVTLYDSLERLGFDLLDEYNMQVKQCDCIVEGRSPSDICRDFSKDI